MGLKRKLDEEVINGIHRKAWDKQIEKHGDKFKVPKDKRDLMAERYRALHVLLTWYNKGCEGSAARFMDKYALRLGTQDWALNKFAEPEDAVRPEKQKNRKQRMRDLESWAVEHAFEQFTTAQLAEQSGFSPSTTLKYLAASPYFTKLKRGLYECRDPRRKKSPESN